MLKDNGDKGMIVTIVYGWSPRNTESVEDDTSYLDKPNSAEVFLCHLEGRLWKVQVSMRRRGHEVYGSYTAVAGTIPIDVASTHLFTRKLDAPLLVRPPLERQTKCKQGKDEHTQGQEGVDVQVLCRKGGGRNGLAGTDFPPLAVVGDYRVLALVDELGERDVFPVAEDVHGLSRVRAVPELEAEEVACVGGRAADELNHQAGGRIRCGIAWSIGEDGSRGS